MTKNNFLLGMLALALIFGMTVVGCDGGSTGGDSGPQWAAATDWEAQPFIGIWSDGGTTLTITRHDEETIFSKYESGGSLNGVWFGGNEAAIRMTISGGKNWTLAYIIFHEEASAGYSDEAKGTLTVSGTTVTFKTTHVIVHDAPTAAPERPDIY